MWNLSPQRLATAPENCKSPGCMKSAPMVAKGGSAAKIASMDAIFPAVMNFKSNCRIVLVLLTGMALNAFATDPLPEPVARVNALPHTVVISHAEQPAVNRELGLGPLEKRSGRWRFKKSERVSGTSHRWTWQITDGYLSVDLHQELRQQLDQREDAQKLFGCNGKRCGPGAQWASGVFKERILYGRDRDQWYSAYRLGDNRLLIYSSARSASRQHLHMEWFELSQ